MKVDVTSATRMRDNFVSATRMMNSLISLTRITDIFISANIMSLVSSVLLELG